MLSAEVDFIQMFPKAFKFHHDGIELLYNPVFDGL